MNNKGQALVEFILILPIFLFLIFAVVDFGLIFNTKSTLENTSTDIVDEIKSGIPIEEVRASHKDLTIDTIEDAKYIKIKLTTERNLITPGASRVLPNPYKITVERTILND